MILNNDTTAAQAYSSIKQVDCLNFTFPLALCRAGVIETGSLKTVSLKDGSFTSSDGRYYVSVDKKAILYADFTGDNINEAVVPLYGGLHHANYSCSEILVYTLRNGKPKLLMTLDDDILGHDYHRYYPPGSILFPGASVNAANGKLILYAAADAPHACPPSKVRFEYRWNGQRFVLVGKPVKTPNGECAR